MFLIQKVCVVYFQQVLKQQLKAVLVEFYVYLICLEFMQRHIYELCSQCVLLFFLAWIFLKLFFQFMLENHLWRKEMFPWLQSLGTLAEDPDLGPSIHMVGHNHH